MLCPLYSRATGRGIMKQKESITLICNIIVDFFLPNLQDNDGTAGQGPSSTSNGICSSSKLSHGVCNEIAIWKTTLYQEKQYLPSEAPQLRQRLMCGLWGRENRKFSRCIFGSNLGRKHSRRLESKAAHIQYYILNPKLYLAHHFGTIHTRAPWEQLRSSLEGKLHKALTETGDTSLQGNMAPRPRAKARFGAELGRHASRRRAHPCGGLWTRTKQWEIGQKKNHIIFSQHYV